MIPLFKCIWAHFSCLPLCWVLGTLRFRGSALTGFTSSWEWQEGGRCKRYQCRYHHHVELAWGTRWAWKTGSVSLLGDKGMSAHLHQECLIWELHKVNESSFSVYQNFTLVSFWTVNSIAKHSPKRTSLSGLRTLTQPLPHHLPSFSIPLPI